MKAKWIAGLVFLALFFILLFQNQQSVTYRIYFWDLSVSQVLVIPVLLLVGFFFGLALKMSEKPKPRGRTREEDEDESADSG